MPSDTKSKRKLLFLTPTLLNLAILFALFLHIALLDEVNNQRYLINDIFYWYSRERIHTNLFN